MYLGITRQAYYKRCKVNANNALLEQSVLSFVRLERMTHPRIGTRKLQYMMKQSQISIGRDRLFTLLRLNRLLVPNKRAFHKTTHSFHRFYKHPNIIKEGIELTRPEQRWVADITYLPTNECDAYLSLVTDAYSRKVVGYHLSDDLKTSSVKLAFKHALTHRKSTTTLIHHSDRGIQYCSNEYQQIHEKHGVICSMTDGYDCYQNALAERVNGILKNEYLVIKPNNLAEAKKMVKQSVEIYNQKRPHTALKYKTPDEVHRAF